jgi:hypothetical protein
MGWHMRCEVHRAVSFDGDLRVDDPDGIVVEARFVPAHLCDQQLSSCAPWVREPLTEWLKERWEPHDRRGFHYEVSGTSRDSMRVVRGARA